MDGNPLVAAPVSQTTAVTGIGIAESCVDLANGVSNGDWVEAGLGGLGVGLEVLSMVIDPLGTLASYGVSWLIEHVRPLKEALDWFAGDPPVIESFSQTWGNVAAEVGAVAQDLTGEVNGGTAGWTGTAGDAYRGHAAQAADAVAGAGTLADGISVGVMVMGQVVAFVREFIRDLVGELVGRLISWALETVATLGLATPLVVAQATTAITKVVNKVADLVRKLVKTIGNVAPRIRKIIDKLDEIIAMLRKLLRKADAPGGTNPARHAGDKPSAHPHAPDGTSPSSTPDTSGSPDAPGAGPGGTRPHGDSPTGGAGARPTDPQSTSTPEPNRVTCNDPVDVVTGEVLLTQVDITLPGALPLVLRRTHVSSYRAGLSFGPSWASTVDQRLESDEEGMVFVAEDGMLLVYPHPPVGRPVLPVHGPRWPLSRTAAGFTITQRETGRTLHFAAGRAACPLVAITDRNDHRIDFDRDAAGLVTAARHSGGYHVDLDSAAGHVTGLRLRNPDGSGIRIARFGFDEAGNLAEVVNSSGRPMRFSYDRAGRLARWTDRNGEWYRYLYDEHGRCVANQGSGGYLNGTFSYDEENRTTRFTDALANTVTYRLDERGNVVAETDALGHTTTSEWDEFDRLLSRTDPLGRTTRYEYDPDGNPTTITRADGSQILLGYNDLGLPVTVVEPDGAVWRREYDERGNVRAVIDPAGAASRYGYDERGNLASVTDVLGVVREFTSNPAGLIVATGDGTRLDLDTFGRVVAVTDPLGGVFRLSWTVEGQLISRTSPDGGVERYAYDGEGNMVEHVDATGRRTGYEYRGMDLPVARTGPDGARLEFGYDNVLRLTSVTNPQGLVWRYEYDAAGNLVRETDFNSRAVGYTYDEAGQLVARTNGAGETVAFTRDPLGQVITKRSDIAATTFAYDPAGRLTAATNGEIALSYERDALGNVIAETVNGRTLRSAYDAAGRRLRRLTPSGTESRWTYDADDRPLALEVAGRTVRFGYDAAGREIRREFGAAVLTQSWDVNHQLRAQRITARANPVQQRVYHYRADGAVIGVDDQLAGSRRFELDRAGRVTAVHGRNWTERYAYDAAGNPTSATLPDATSTTGPREYAGTLIRRAGNTTYRHDAQGRVVERHQRTLSGQRRAWTYAWDADDRLIGLTTPDGTRWRYDYDAIGRRVGKQRLDESGAAVESTVFVWDGFLLAEQTHYPDATTTSWDWDPDNARPVTQIERVASAPQDWIDVQFYALVTDLVGTPTEMVDPQGNVARTAPRTLWGQSLAVPDGPYCPLRFPGQYHDQESGLAYNLYRYYDAESSRFASGDPLGLSGGTGPHSYVPNPVEWSDPLGLTPQCVRDLMRSQKRGAPDLLDKGVHVSVYGRAGNMEVKIVPTRDGGVTFKPAHPGRAAQHPREWDAAVREVRNAMEHQEFRDWVRKHAEAGIEQARSVSLPTLGDSPHPKVKEAWERAIGQRSKIVEFKALLKALDRM
ncbi:MAG TPA: DUF6531 domain-containing protein [Actinophytocola sp.]|nr:DUF6531 domain-containing protein [Actinophytocola sp.]HET9143099.1 DUF6531 domain-containing protein [Actinophytocola sp.]